MNQRCEFHWCFNTRCNFTKHTICIVNCGMQTCFKFAILVLNYSSASLICYMFPHCFMYVYYIFRCLPVTFYFASNLTTSSFALLHLLLFTAFVFHSFVRTFVSTLGTFVG